MSKKDPAHTPATQKPRFRFFGKFFLFILLALVLILLFQNPHQWKQYFPRDSSKKHALLEKRLHLLQRKIDSLQENQVVATDALSVESPDARPLFLFHRLMGEYYEGHPFASYLEGLLDLPSSPVEQNDKILWLLDYGKKGPPTVHRLLLLLEHEPHEKPVTQESPTPSFWKEPMGYMKNLFQWKKLVTIEKDQKKHDQKTLYSLLVSKEFEKALSFSKTAETSFHALTQTLENLIKSREILREIEERLFNTLGAVHEN